jgi:hypothetical protein
VALAGADPPMAMDGILIVLMLLSLVAPLIGYPLIQRLSVGCFG